MVVQGILALALALPTGTLFGVGYGTGVRIGYEQIYPLLFPDGQRGSTTQVVESVKEINKIYDAIGGKEASQMGMGAGIAAQLDDLKKNLTPEDYQALILGSSGPTQSNLSPKKASAVNSEKSSEISIDSKEPGGRGDNWHDKRSNIDNTNKEHKDWSDYDESEKHKHTTAERNYHEEYKKKMHKRKVLFVDANSKSHTLEMTQEEIDQYKTRLTYQVNTKVTPVTITYYPVPPEKVVQVIIEGVGTQWIKGRNVQYYIRNGYSFYSSNNKYYLKKRKGTK